MPTFTALTTLTGKDPAERLGLALENMQPEPTGVGVFEVEDGSGIWEVGGYFLEAPDEAALALLSAAFDTNPFVVSEIPDQDWVAKVRRELPPVSAGRFFVYGSHDADQVPQDKHALLIEAAMAFGTGHHGTTLGCLEALDGLIDEGFEAQNAIDVGCGTAVLAMAAAIQWGKPVMASDIDRVAVDVAVANCAANQLQDLVYCLEAAGLEHPQIAGKAPYDLVFANILMGPLIALAPSMAAATAAGGYAILSGILNEQAADVTEVYLQNGYNLTKKGEIGEWTTLTLQKRR
ncbi:50S ribosomal protein L11 methyltransferase [Algirhabdus cladophorae]|uniref:50S ribosomal protein L11 methyltransferase n=1 Tax=Algirhabdus cladophorae TaxID=3377108 RepID=UPI003B84B621